MDRLNVRCVDCEKKYVCKYADSMLKVVNEINVALSSFNKDLPFSIARMDCDYFSMEKPTTKGW